MNLKLGYPVAEDFCQLKFFANLFEKITNIWLVSILKGKFYFLKMVLICTSLRGFALIITYKISSQTCFYYFF